MKKIEERADNYADIAIATNNLFKAIARYHMDRAPDEPMREFWEKAIGSHKFPIF